MIELHRSPQVEAPEKHGTTGSSMRQQGFGFEQFRQMIQRDTQRLTIAERLTAMAVALQPGQHGMFVLLMRDYYSELPTELQPANWPEILEGLEERDAIQRDSLEAYKNRRIFTRGRG
jgi:hypothetical protein